MCFKANEINTQVKNILENFNNLGENCNEILSQHKKEVLQKYAVVKELYNSSPDERQISYHINPAHRVAFFKAVTDFQNKINETAPTIKTLKKIIGYHHSAHHAYSWEKPFYSKTKQPKPTAKEVLQNYVLQSVISNALIKLQKTQHVEFLVAMPYMHDQDNNGMQIMKFSRVYQIPYKIAIRLRDGGYFYRCETEYLLTHNPINIPYQRTYTNLEEFNDVQDDDKDALKNVTPQDAVSIRLRLTTSPQKTSGLTNILSDEETNSTFNTMLNLGPELLQVTNHTLKALKENPLSPDIEQKYANIKEYKKFSISANEVSNLRTAVSYLYVDKCKKFFSSTTEYSLWELFHTEFKNITIIDLKLYLKPSLIFNSATSKHSLEEPNIQYLISVYSHLTMSFDVFRSEESEKTIVQFHLHSTESPAKVTRFITLECIVTPEKLPKFQEKLKSSKTSLKTMIFSKLGELNHKKFDEKMNTHLQEALRRK